MFKTDRSRKNLKENFGFIILAVLNYFSYNTICLLRQFKKQQRKNNRFILNVMKVFFAFFAETRKKNNNNKKKHSTIIT